MSFQDFELIFVLFGGYVILAIAAIYFLLPISKSFGYRRLLMAACIIPDIMGFVIFVLKNFIYSGQAIIKLAPFGISLLLFFYVLHGMWGTSAMTDTKFKHSTVVVLLIFSNIWAGAIAWYALDSCFLGACV